MVSKAVVTAANTSTGLSREATTDAAGYYSIANLLEGTYDLSVRAGGFKPYTQRGVEVPINVVTRVDIAIRVGEFSEQVNVEAAPAVLQTTKSDVNVHLDERTIENVPLSNYRNYQTLINLVPGATPARFQNAVTDTPGRALSANINGQERGANNTRVDGSADILVTMPHHAVWCSSRSPPRARISNSARCTIPPATGQSWRCSAPHGRPPDGGTPGWRRRTRRSRSSTKSVRTRS